MNSRNYPCYHIENYQLVIKWKKLRKKELEEKYKQKSKTK